MKPGYKSTEFWFSLAAAVVGGLMASGAFPDDSGFGRVLGLIASVLASLGYAASRAWVKTSESKAAALKAAASPLPPASQD